jgi:hypothetical protein
MDEDSLEHVGEHVLDLVHILLQLLSLRHQHLQPARKVIHYNKKIYLHKMNESGPAMTAGPGKHQKD